MITEDVSRGVPSGEERGEMDVFAGYNFCLIVMNLEFIAQRPRSDFTNAEAHSRNSVVSTQGTVSLKG